MPRIYHKKLGPQGKCNYDKKFIQRAVTAVRKGNMSIRQASEQYGVPFSTVQRRVKGTHSLKYGRQPVLTDEEEERIKESLVICAVWGFPLRSTDIRIVVQQYLNAQGRHETRFKENLPGHDWFQCFMKRHPELTIKLAENTKRVRAGLSYEIIEAYFQNLNETIKDIPPANIVNYDETNFGDDPGAVKVVTKRGSKHTFRTIDATKSSTTVMFAIAGDGTLLPPYVVYKAKHMYEGWTENGLEGTRYNRSLSGWFDSELFEDWFKSIALPYFRKLPGPKVLLGDNLNSHLTVSVIQQCEANNIRFSLLPPNATHLLQPLDVAYFRPLKRCWKNNLDEWKKKNRGVLPKTEFPNLLKKTVLTIGIKSAENSRAGFEACGIIPFNPNRVLQKIPQNIQPDDTQARAWSQAIIEHLEQLKTGAGSTVQKRGKKVNISPGKSISSADLLIKSLTDQAPKERSKQKATEPILSSESEPEIEEHSDGSLEESAKATETKTQISDDDDSPEVLPSSNTNDWLKVGDYIVAGFPTSKRLRRFIGKIEFITEKDMTINVLRKQGLEKGYFVYPEIPDLALIENNQFQYKIKLKSIKRGKHLFHLDLNEFQNLE